MQAYKTITATTKSELDAQVSEALKKDGYVLAGPLVVVPTVELRPHVVMEFAYFQPVQSLRTTVEYAMSVNPI